jgi:hypothetical protein
MFTSMSVWLKSHATAILATAIAISKAGLLGKAATSIVMVLANALAGAVN